MGKYSAALCACGEPAEYIAKAGTKGGKKVAEGAYKCAACGAKGAISIAEK